MKKLFSTKAYKKRNTRNAKRSQASKSRLRKFVRINNILKLGKPKIQIATTNKRRKYHDYIKIKAPIHFSFLKNSEESSEFISEIKKNFNRRKKVFVIMRHIKSIDHSAIVILLSVMVRFKAQKIKFNGDFPDNDDIAKLFMKSGFFSILDKEELKDTDSYDLGFMIATRARKRTDPGLSEKIMKTVTSKLHGELRVYKGLHRVLSELMQNSFNHAVPGKEGEKHWWLSVDSKIDDRTVSFSFIDYGVGIFESLNNKEDASKWFKWREKLLKLFTFETNADILRLILDGNLHSTVTGQYFRGKGLPGIKEVMERNQISNLHIISNDVYADVANNNFMTLRTNFEGTFVYWEINDHTENLPWVA